MRKVKAVEVIALAHPVLTNLSVSITADGNGAFVKGRQRSGDRGCFS